MRPQTWSKEDKAKALVDILIVALQQTQVSQAWTPDP